MKFTPTSFAAASKVFAILTVVVLCLAMLLPVSAAGTHIFDQTNAIGNISTLETYAQQIEDNYGYSVLLSVIDGVGSEGTYGYCEDLYNANAAKENGVAQVRLPSGEVRLIKLNCLATIGVVLSFLATYLHLIILVLNNKKA